MRNGNSTVGTSGSPPRRRARRAAVASLLALLCVPGIAVGQDSGLSVRDPVDADAVWSGRVLVEQNVIVGPDATLTIRPGTEVVFADGAGLLVHGALVAEGTREQPIRFASAASQPTPGSWAGITLLGDHDRSRLAHCAVTHATGISIGAGAHRVEHCEIRDGIKGFVLHGVGTRPALLNNRLADLSGGGIECLNSSAPSISDTIIERCGPFGIAATTGAAPLVQRTTISGCAEGIGLANTAPSLRDNVLRNNSRGIVLTQVNGGNPIQGNRIVDGEVGILCQHFSNPVIAGNVVSGNKDGIVCFQGARPLIQGNAIESNGTGITCVQLANAEVRDNLIAGNKRGIYLQTSSYATIRGNNIVDNGVQLELGDMMSADWERRAGNKPRRGLQQQSDARSQRTGAAPLADQTRDGADIVGFVDATENWWGERDTGEMEHRGPDANITGLLDAFDAPTRTYEGFEGTFALDRVRYAPWAKTRIETAGLPAPGAQPAEGARE